MSKSHNKSVEEINQEFFGEFFNQNTVDYLSKSAGSRWFKYLLLSVIKNIDPKNVASIADIGCGIGHKTSILKSYFINAEVSGYDFADRAIKVAKSSYGKKQNIKFSCEDITESKYMKRFDLIAAFDVLEHVDKWEELVEKLIKVNNRYILFSFPVGRMRPYEKNIGHYRNFSRGQMEKFMKERGYKTNATFYAGFPFFSPITRDLTQMFFKNYSETTNSKMSTISQLNHNVWYILYRYFSAKHKGDVFIGLFEKEDLSTKAKESVRSKHKAQ